MSGNYPKNITIGQTLGELDSFSKDLDFDHGCPPQAVAKLKNSDDAVDLVRWANKESSYLIPVSSSGPRRRGDTVPQKKGAIIADLSSMQSLKHADYRDKIAIIEPGVNFAMIDDLLRPYDLRAYRPLKPRAGKSVIASYLDREPILCPKEHWDVSDPLGGTSVVLGSGDLVLTGGAAVEGSLEEQLKWGNRHLFQPGPAAIDLLRVMQGSQGSLGIMTWAAVYCERIPSIEKSWFASSYDLNAVMNTARDILHRNIATTLFIVDKVQLALLMSKDANEFEQLNQRLPEWILFVSVASKDHNPELKVQWQSEEIIEYANKYDLVLHEELNSITAQSFSDDLRNTERVFYKDRPYGAHKEMFFLRSFSDAYKSVSNMRNFVSNTDANVHDISKQAIGTYIQPMIQGTYAHIEFTMPYSPNGYEQENKVRDYWRLAAEGCAASGAFFSRPYYEWRDFAFEQNPDALKMLNSTKSILDPKGTMNSDRFPFGRVLS